MSNIRPSASYSLKMDSQIAAPPVSDLARFQMLKAVKTQFYIHKSFDIQSDMEFLPTIPNEYDHHQYHHINQHYNNPIASHIIPKSNISSPIMSPSMQYSMVDYGNTSASSPQVHNDQQLYTPKTRNMYMNASSPRRTVASNINLRKRVASMTPPAVHQQIHQQLPIPPQPQPQQQPQQQQQQQPQQQHFGGGIHMVDPNQLKQQRGAFNGRNW